MRVVTEIDNTHKKFFFKKMSTKFDCHKNFWYNIKKGKNYEIY